MPSSEAPGALSVLWNGAATTRSPSAGTDARAWLIWGVGVAAYVLAVTNRSSLSAVGVDAAARFDADAATLSMFAVVQLAVYGGMQIPIGVLLDRYGARPIMTIGMILMAVGQLTMALSPSVGVAIIARMLLGAGDAAIFPGVLRLVATWFPAQRGPLMVQFTGIVRQVRAALRPHPPRGTLARDDVDHHLRQYRRTRRAVRGPGSLSSSATILPIATTMSPSTPTPARFEW